MALTHGTADLVGDTCCPVCTFAASKANSIIFRVARTVHMHLIWLYALWFPCQKKHIFTVCIVQANLTHFPWGGCTVCTPFASLECTGILKPLSLSVPSCYLDTRSSNSPCTAQQQQRRRRTAKCCSSLTAASAWRRACRWMPWGLRGARGAQGSPAIVLGLNSLLDLLPSYVVYLRVQALQPC